MSGLLPPSCWQQEPGWAKGDGEGEPLCLGKTEVGFAFFKVAKSQGGNRMLGRRGGHAGGFEGLLRKYAQVQGLGREQGNSSWVRTNVRTLAFMDTNGIGHAEVILKTCEDAGCDIIGLQEVRRNLTKVLLWRRGMLCFAQEQTEENTKRRGTTG